MFSGMHKQTAFQLVGGVHNDLIVGSYHGPKLISYLGKQVHYLLYLAIQWVH